MSTTFGTYSDGRIVLDVPVDWPEGSRVAVVPSAGAAIGLTEAEWPDRPEARAALLARIEAIEPLELTPVDDAEIGEARQAVRKATIESVRRRMGLAT